MDLHRVIGIFAVENIRLRETVQQLSEELKRCKEAEDKKVEDGGPDDSP